MRFIAIFCGLFLVGCAGTQNLLEKASITEARTGFPVLASYDDASEQSVDHVIFEAFLEKYVVTDSDGVNRVRYASVTGQDQASLTRYLDTLQSVRVTALDREEQFAFWINLYNAETIRVILENYPVASIRGIKDNLLDFKGPWNNPRLRVEGQTLTLDDVENKIIRPIFKDPRIHYALNCAALGCPNLRKRAYTGDGLSDVLDSQARDFINHPRGVSVTDGKVAASRIFLWYQEDYGQNEQDVLAHIRAYAEPELVQSLEGMSKINRYVYDWTLNDAAPD